MKKKLMAMVLAMAVCVGQVEAAPGDGLSPIPSPNGSSPITCMMGTIFDSLLDNQFGKLLSSAMDFLDVCFGRDIVLSLKLVK